MIEILLKNTIICKKIINHRSPMQIKKSQPSCQRIMPETRLTSFLVLSVYPRVEISRSGTKIDDRCIYRLPVLFAGVVVNSTVVGFSIVSHFMLAHVSVKISENTRR